MKFAFFGSPKFAAIVLGRIIDSGFTPNAVICNPDRPVGRKQILTAPDTKLLLQERGLDQSVRIFQPEKPSLILQELTDLQADFFVVAAYAKIIPRSVLALPRLGTIGVHPSLLPKYRGASPIQSALLSGEEKTGVALYLLGPGVDDGPVFAERDTAIAPDENYEQLLPRLAELGGDMLSELIPPFFEEKAKAEPQDESAATLTRKFTTEDGFVPEDELAAAMGGEPATSSALHNKIRALSSEPGVWTIKNGKRIKLLESSLENGVLKLLRIHREGKTPEAFRGSVWG